jgi:hypothetical protein
MDPAARTPTARICKTCTAAGEAGKLRSSPAVSGSLPIASLQWRLFLALPWRFACAAVACEAMQRHAKGVNRVLRGECLRHHRIGWHQTAVVPIGELEKQAVAPP